MPAAFATVLVAAAAGPSDDARAELAAGHDGRVVRSGSGELVAAFASAVAALRCAVALQRSAAGTGLRIGIDAGEQAEELATATHDVAARLCEAAGDGEVLVSDLVARIAGDHVAEPLRAAGTVHVRGAAGAVPVSELVWRAEPGADGAAPTAPAQPPVRVVIADDQQLLRTGFRVIIEAEPDLTVVGEAGDGRAAVDVVARRRPDVVLMDIRMPELDGLEAAERILTDPELDTAVVMLTTFDTSEYVYEALRIGASGFLLKDTPPDRLLDAIRVSAAGEALIAPSITRRLIEQFAHGARPVTDAVPPELAELTERELDVLRLVARGLSNAEIARELILGENTIKTHVSRVLMKLGLRDRVQAVVVAYESGLVQRGLASER